MLLCDLHLLAFSSISRDDCAGKSISLSLFLSLSSLPLDELTFISASYSRSFVRCDMRRQRGEEKKTCSRRKKLLYSETNRSIKEFSRKKKDRDSEKKESSLNKSTL